MEDKKRFSYCYYAAYRGQIYMNTLFENISIYFKYTDFNKCVKEGKEWYKYNAHDDYLAFLEYDKKYDCITQIYVGNGVSTLNYRDGSWYNTSEENIDMLKELLSEKNKRGEEMNFTEAYKALEMGLPIKRKEWDGYWVLEGTDIVIHLKEGNNLKLTDTEDVMFTLSHTTKDDWEVATLLNCKRLKEDTNFNE